MEEQVVDKKSMNVLVALDGSGDWTEIVDELARIMVFTGQARVVLYHVLELRSSGEHRGERSRIPVRPPDDADGVWLAERRSDIEEGILMPARQRIEAAASGEVTVETSIAVAKDSSVADLILEKARQGGFEALVLGWGKPGPETGEHEPGSVTAEIVGRKPACPVWVLARPAEAGAIGRA